VRQLFLIVLVLFAASCRDKGITPPDPTDNAEIAFTRLVGSQWEIFMIQADGTGERNLTNNPANDVNPSWSPDGSRLTFSSDRDGIYSIYVMNADGSNVRRLTTPQSPNLDALPSWSPDGSRIAFTRFDSVDGDTRLGGDIFLVNPDGTGLTNFTNTPARAELNPTWSADGSSLAFEAYGGGQPRNIFRTPVAGGTAVNVTNHAADDFKPAWSRPGNSHIAFTSNRPGNNRWSIYIVDTSGNGLRQLTNATSGQDSNAAWSKDGLRLAFNRRSSGTSAWDLHIIGADGTGLRRLATRAGEPAWKP
jgi:Tol biopolymer transport system component